MGEFACIAAPWAGEGGGPSTGERQRTGWGPESGENANRYQTWAEGVESGKNATQKIGMLTHPAAGPDRQMRKYHRVMLSLYAGFYNKGRDH